MTLPRSLSAVDSPLAHWDARWKLAGLLVLGWSCAIVQSPRMAGIALALALLFVGLARLSLRSALAMSVAILIGVVPLAIAIPFLKADGANEALALVLRALAVGLIGHVSVASAPPHRTFAALQSLRVPRILVLLIQFSYRYAILLAGEVRRIRVAMAVRGFRVRPSVRSVSTMGNLIGSVLVRGGDRAETVNHAMHARGFDGHIRMLTAFRTTTRDVLAFGVATILAITLYVLDRAIFAS
jgi:cobalt/nickel transport system permease protein